MIKNTKNLKALLSLMLLGLTSTSAFASDITTQYIEVRTNDIAISNYHVEIPSSSWVCGGDVYYEGKSSQGNIGISGPYDGDKRKRCEANLLTYNVNGFNQAVSPYFILHGFDISFDANGNNIICHIATEVGLSYYKTGVLTGIQSMLVSNVGKHDSSTPFFTCGSSGASADYKYNVVTAKVDGNMIYSGWINIQPN